MRRPVSEPNIMKHASTSGARFSTPCARRHVTPHARSHSPRWIAVGFCSLLRMSSSPFVRGASLEVTSNEKDNGRTPKTTVDNLYAPESNGHQVADADRGIETWYCPTYLKTTPTATW